MATTTLFPNDQTYARVVTAILAGNTSVMWVLNNRVALGFNPALTTSPKVYVTSPVYASTFNGLVVRNGNSGLAAGVNGSYGFVWSPTTSGQDDAAQAAVLDPASLVFTATTYSV